MSAYLKALSRDDLSQWLLHLCKPPSSVPIGQPIWVLQKILNDGIIAASKSEHILKFDPAGVVSFYDVPPQIWRELIDTNPSGRKGYGLVFSKNILWFLGARPTIYTDSPNDSWPTSQRYRLINTDLNKRPNPVDWTHEREWRWRGDFQFVRSDINLQEPWWWPVVERIMDAQSLLKTYSGIHQVYITELNHVINCTDTLLFVCSISPCREIACGVRSWW
jgi:hypothetical protein